MTVTTTANAISYTGNGTTTAFAFPYIFFEPTDLVVTLVDSATGLIVSPMPVLNGLATYDYTVTGTVSDGEYASGATVTFNTAPLAAYSVIFRRAVPATQTVTLLDNTKFPAATVNTEFDKLTILAQQTGFLTTTALQIPSYEEGLIVTAVPAASRANRILSWDGLGNLTTLDPVSLIGGAVPAGPAGGDLAGTYPSPTIKPSVALTGNPTATTQAAGTNNTTLATTAFVSTATLKLASQAVGTGSTTFLNVTFPAGARSVELHWFLESAIDTAMSFQGSIGGVAQGGAHYHLGYQLSSLTVMSAGQVYSAPAWVMTSAAIQSWGTATFTLPYDGYGNGLVSVRDTSASRAHYTMFFETDRSFSSFNGFIFSANTNLTANSFVRCFALI